MSTPETTTSSVENISDELDIRSSVGEREIDNADKSYEVTDEETKANRNDNVPMVGEQAEEGSSPTEALSLGAQKESTIELAVNNDVELEKVVEELPPVDHHQGEDENVLDGTTSLPAVEEGSASSVEGEESSSSLFMDGGEVSDSDEETIMDGKVSDIIVEEIVDDHNFNEQAEVEQPVGGASLSSRLDDETSQTQTHSVRQQIIPEPTVAMDENHHLDNRGIQTASRIFMDTIPESSNIGTAGDDVIAFSNQHQWSETHVVVATLILLLLISTFRGLFGVRKKQLSDSMTCLQQNSTTLLNGGDDSSSDVNYPDCDETEKEQPSQKIVRNEASASQKSIVAEPSSTISKCAVAEEISSSTNQSEEEPITQSKKSSAGAMDGLMGLLENDVNFGTGAAVVATQTYHKLAENELQSDLNAESVGDDIMKLLANDGKYGQEMPSTSPRSEGVQEIKTDNIDADIMGLLANDTVYGKVTPTSKVMSKKVEKSRADNIDDDIMGLLANDTVYGKVTPTSKVMSKKVEKSRADNIDDDIMGLLANDTVYAKVTPTLKVMSKKMEKSRADNIDDDIMGILANDTVYGKVTPTSKVMSKKVEKSMADNIDDDIMGLLANDTVYGKVTPTSKAMSKKVEKSRADNIDDDIMGLLANDTVYGKGISISLNRNQADDINTSEVDESIMGLFSNDMNYGNKVPTSTANSRSEGVENVADLLANDINFGNKISNEIDTRNIAGLYANDTSYGVEASPTKSGVAMEREPYSENMDFNTELLSSVPLMSVDDVKSHNFDDMNIDQNYPDFYQSSEEFLVPIKDSDSVVSKKSSVSVDEIKMMFVDRPGQTQKGTRKASPQAKNSLVNRRDSLSKTLSDVSLGKAHRKAHSIGSESQLTDAASCDIDELTSFNINATDANSVASKKSASSYGARSQNSTQLQASNRAAEWQETSRAGSESSRRSIFSNKEIRTADWGSTPSLEFSVSQRDKAFSELTVNSVRTSDDGLQPVKVLEKASDTASVKQGNDEATSDADGGFFQELKRASNNKHFTRSAFTPIGEVDTSQEEEFRCNACSIM